MATSVTLKPNAIDISGSTSGTTTLQASAVAGTTTLTLPAATDTLVGKATTDTLTNKTLTGAAMNGTLGATTPSTASVTTLTTSSTVTHSGGTANGVAYLDGSKVLTTGSALVFDGTNLGLGVTPSAWGGTGQVALQIGTGTSGTANFAGGGTKTLISSNQYYNGSVNKYINNGYAQAMVLDTDSSFSWIQAASGTAGNTASFFTKMTLDASGRLGIGTTTMSTSENLVVSNGTVDLVMSPGAFSSGNTAMIGTKTNHGISFAINTAQKMAIDTSGNLLVGTTSSTNLQNNYSFLVGGSLPGAGSACFNGQNGNTVLQVNQTLDDDADRGQIYFYRNESLIGKITSSNTVTLFTSLSDYRLKNTIVPMTGALAKVALLKPCTYKWNSDNSDGQGFIAHELAEVFPIAVSGEKDAVDSEGNLDYQGVDTSVLVATLTAAIQEQQALITQLTARITALEAT